MGRLLTISWLSLSIACGGDSPRDPSESIRSAMTDGDEGDANAESGVDARQSTFAHWLRNVQEKFPRWGFQKNEDAAMRAEFQNTVAQLPRHSVTSAELGMVLSSLGAGWMAIGPAVQDVVQAMLDQNKIVQPVEFAKVILDFKANTEVNESFKNNRIVEFIKPFKTSDSWKDLDRLLDVTTALARAKLLVNIDQYYQVLPIETLAPKQVTKAILVPHSAYASVMISKRHSGWPDEAVFASVKKIYERAHVAFSPDDLIYLFENEVTGLESIYNKNKSSAFPRPQKENVKELIKLDPKTGYVSLVDWPGISLALDSADPSTRANAEASLMSFFRRAPWGVSAYARTEHPRIQAFYETQKDVLYSGVFKSETAKNEYDGLTRDEIRRVESVMSQIERVIAKAITNLDQSAATATLGEFFPGYAAPVVRAKLSKVINKLHSVSRLGGLTFRRDLAESGMLSEVASVFLGVPNVVNVEKIFFEQPNFIQVHLLLHELTHATLGTADIAKLNGEYTTIYRVGKTHELIRENSHADNGGKTRVDSEVIRVADPLTYLVIQLAQPLKGQGVTIPLSCDYTFMHTLTLLQRPFWTQLVSAKQGQLSEPQLQASLLATFTDEHGWARSAAQTVADRCQPDDFAAVAGAMDHSVD